VKTVCPLFGYKKPNLFSALIKLAENQPELERSI